MKSQEPKTKVTSISFDEPKETTAIYKKWWVWVIAVFLAIVLPVAVYLLVNSHSIFGGASSPISPLAL